jgi:hypothetical protein
MQCNFILLSDYKETLTYLIYIIWCSKYILLLPLNWLAQSKQWLWTSEQHSAFVIVRDVSRNLEPNYYQLTGVFCIVTNSFPSFLTMAWCHDVFHIKRDTVVCHIHSGSHLETACFKVTARSHNVATWTV